MPEVTDPVLIQKIKAARSAAPVYGAPPKPKTPTPQTADQIRSDQLGNQMKELQIAELHRKEKEEAAASEARTRAYAAADYQLQRAIKKMNEIRKDATDNDGWFETGTSGNMMRDWTPGVFQNAARDLDANVDALRTKFALDALQAMREASKTGGAVGQVTEGEWERLANSVENISPRQSHGQFLKNLDNAREYYLEKLRLINPAAADKLSGKKGATNKKEASGWGKVRVVK